MTAAESALNRIEAILADVERSDASTGGQFRQRSDREALNIAKRIERKMAAAIAEGKKQKP